MTDKKLPTLRVSGQFAVHKNNSPLHERVPVCNEAGKFYSDFMILIPKLNKAPLPVLKQKMAALQAVLVNHTEVVFVDLNMKINLLWISFEPRKGLIEQIVVEIQASLPEAKLISAEFRASA